VRAAWHSGRRTAATPASGGAAADMKYSSKPEADTSVEPDHRPDGNGRS
jgi:hypothetical protein